MARFILIALLLAGTASAQEIGAGVTFNDGASGSEVYELSFTDNRWRYSLGHVTTGSYDDLRTLKVGMGPFQDPTKPIEVDAWSYISATYIYPIKDAYVGIGIAVHEKRLPVIGEHFSFTPTLGYRFGQQWSTEISHKSNANLGRFNYGHNALIIRYKF